MKIDSKELAVLCCFRGTRMSIRTLRILLGKQEDDVEEIETVLAQLIVLGLVEKQGTAYQKTDEGHRFLYNITNGYPQFLWNWD